MPKNGGTPGTGVPISAVALLFVLSGAAGLVDQVCFSKYLSYVVGSTAHAVSAVLAAFMGGMALGAQLGGRFAARVRRPLVAYGVLELAVAVAVAVTPLAFGLVSDAYVALVRGNQDSLAFVSAARWVSAVLVVVLPTTAMGATLPLLARLTEHHDEPRKRERVLGLLYASNTLGGALGSIGCAYVILPALGLRSATLAAAAGSGVVGVLAILVGRRETSERHRSADGATPRESGGAPAWVLDLTAFASGALVFSCEVLFVHLLVLVVGTSAYAFGVILSIFLVCLFFGAGLAPIAHRALGRASLPLALALAALALTATLDVWQRLPDLFRGAAGSKATFEEREIVRGVAAFTALAIPTTLMGLTFPLLLQIVARRADVGRIVGRVTSVNTLGSVTGALFAGYVLLPALGSQRSIIAVSAAFAVVGLVVAAYESPRAALAKVARYGAAAIAVASVVFGLTAPTWNLSALTGGYHVYFDWGRGEEEIVFVSEDTQGGVTTVTEKDGVRTLLTNGKFQGNDGGEVSAQRFFAHYPGMFVPQFDRALVIGLGTGSTLGTLAAYPFKKIDVAEISPAIVRAATTYFEPIGAGALHDDRVTLFLEDGRNHLLISDAKYDLIGIELTSVWFAGAGSLYSREFYALVKERLAPGGILQQWIQMHHLFPRDLATVIHTLRLELPHVALFYGGGQGILVASADPLRASAARLDELEATLGAMRPSRPLRSLGVDVLATGAGLDAFIAEVAQEVGAPVEALVSTDDNLYLEYATPRGNVLPWSSREEMVSRVRAHRDPAAVAELVGP